MEQQGAIPGVAERRVERCIEARCERVVDRIAEEVPVAVHYAGQPFAVMMATPHDLEDFAVGFSLSEGLVEADAQILGIDIRPRLEGIELAIAVSPEAAAGIVARDARGLPGRSGCGLCGTRALEEAVRPPLPLRNRRGVSPDALQRALAELPRHQPMNAATGGVHAAAWVDDAGHVMLAREDVGRHNALDKLIGAMARARCTTDAGMLLVTSRASYEIVTKAARVGIGCIAAISAPTTLALDLARSTGVCLVGFARPGGYNVYAGEAESR